jgi:PAS domain S-box-containing protein
MPMQMTNDELLGETERLRFRLEEAEAVVEAIRSGIVDAVVVKSPPNECVYTLEGADRPYRLLVEAMQQGVAVLNAEGMLLYCNLCFADLFNMSVEDVTGSIVDQLAAVADNSILDHLLSTVDGRPAKMEVLFRKADATTFPAALALSALPSRRFCLLVTDLSQQKQYDELVVSKAALRQSETRYRRLFETAKDGILILDTESGRITDANPFMSDLLGYSHDHFLGKELWEIGLFKDKPANEAAVRQLQQNGYIRYEHLPLETSRHLQVEVEVVANSYREANHSVIQCNMRDITDRIFLRRQVQEQAAALVDRDRRKDVFLATLAHELRNPLAPIRNSLQIMKLPNVSVATIERARDVMERQVHQLVRLVDDLMDVSRYMQGKIELRKERIELATAVARAVETARPGIDAQRHDLTVSLPTESLPLEADPVRLAQVLSNLLTNAGKYTEPGGRIWLTAERHGDEAVLRIKDSGIGIGPDMLPRVFDMFVQVDPAATRSQGGLGIGLMLVKTLVMMHGGNVEANSAGLGTGSEFVVRLPLVSRGLGEPEAPGKNEFRHSPFSRRRVLVVDDNVDAADSLATLLCLGGHEVQVAHGGPAALELVKVYRPEMAFLDIGMPGMDGYEVARRMRKQPGLEKVVLAALTGWGQEEDRRRTSEAGFDHHLVKPPELKMVESLLAGLKRETGLNASSTTPCPGTADSR